MLISPYGCRCFQRACRRGANSNSVGTITNHPNYEAYVQTEQAIDLGQDFTVTRHSAGEGQNKAGCESAGGVTRTSDGS